MSVKYTLFQNVVGPTHSAVSNDPCSRHCVSPLFCKVMKIILLAQIFRVIERGGVTGGWRVFFWFGQENSRDRRGGVFYGVWTGEQ